MSQRNFITAHILCEFIQISPSHSCTQIARRLFNIINRLKYIGFINSYRYIQFPCIFLYNLTVFRTVTGIHNQKFHFKFKFIVKFKFLKKFCHKHWVFSARYTNRNLVTLFNQIISINCFCKHTPNFFTEFFSYTLFNVTTYALGLFSLYRIQQPCSISALKAHRVNAFFS